MEIDNKVQMYNMLVGTISNTGTVRFLHFLGFFRIVAVPVELVDSTLSESIKCQKNQHSIRVHT